MKYVRILHLATTIHAFDGGQRPVVAAGSGTALRPSRQVRDLAEPLVPVAPALTLSGKPDLNIYDRLLTGSLAAVRVCA